MRIYDINPADHTIIDPAGRECPLDPMTGEPKLPGGVMDEAPPKAGKNQSVIAVNGSWQTVPDWRGHEYWLADGSRHEITELNIEPPPDALDQAPPETLDTLTEEALARINAGYQAQMGQILNDYPKAETMTWERQEREARQWQADNGVATPYIDAMLTERPMDKAELVTRILDKARAFTLASATATGKRQRLEDEIQTALDAEDREGIEAIAWNSEAATTPEATT